ncbi:MAG TPA: hypothetical protein VFF10_09340 [Trueperaceae bacterium]|nr:hypothetical protein [Trueperaceae bacterium]
MAVTLHSPPLTADRDVALRVDPLRIVDVAVPAVSSSDPDVAVWKDRHGNAVAFGLVAGSYRWLIVKGVGAYRSAVVPRDPKRLSVDVVGEQGVGLDVLEDFFLRTVLPVAVQAHGLEAVHASAVAIDGVGVVVFCADAFTGKSTLAYALGRHGARHIADDFVVFDPQTLEALPVPFAARLRKESALRFDAPRRSKVLASSVGWDRRLSERLPIAAVCLLERGSDDTTLEPTRGANVLGRLLSEAFVDDITQPARKRSLVEAYFRLKARVPVFRLSYPDGLGHLPAVCERITRFASHRELA